MVAIKDILVILSPIVIAYISYRSNKKSKQEIQEETSQVLQRINAELESQKMLASWNNSLPQTNEYSKLAGVERYGNICALPGMIANIREALATDSLSLESVRDLKIMMGKINLPAEDESLFPYEIPYLLSYKQLVKDIDNILLKAENDQQAL